MSNAKLSILSILLITVGCSDATIKINSTQISPEQAETIIDNINTRYPDISSKEKQQIADVAVKAIEDLVFVEGGSFDMGDFGAPCEIPSRVRGRLDWTPDVDCNASVGTGETGSILHKVTLDSYSISKYETLLPDMEVMRKVQNLPFAYSLFGDQKTYPRGSKDYKAVLKEESLRAASTKDWQDAKSYCLWLGDITSLPFDLPTEAQWEYAARSRGQHYYFATNTGYLQIFGDIYYVPEIQRYKEYSKEEVNAASLDVEDVNTFPPNPLGIYGMTNNVREWVNDWYSPDYYAQSPEHNPQGSDTGDEKVQRDASGITMTFDRLYSAGEKKYSMMVSFRCSLQKTSPATVI